MWQKRVEMRGLKPQVNNGSLGNFWGIGPYDVYEADGSLTGLFNTEEVYAQEVPSTFAKDVLDYYDASYIYQIYENEIKKGNMKDYSTLMKDIPNALPDTTDDIKRIDSQLDEIMMKAIPKVVMAESKEAFESEKEKVIQELKDAKAETSQEWWFTEWGKAKAFVTGK